jgi:hypothetical protein
VNINYQKKIDDLNKKILKLENDGKQQTKTISNKWTSI